MQLGLTNMDKSKCYG